MGVEIERKFLVTAPDWKSQAGVAGCEGIRFRQGYIPSETAVVRVRLEGRRGVLTIKSAGQGLTRLEFEYDIPEADALQMLDQVCVMPQIDKIRYTVEVAGHVWEVDEFLGDNAGLVVAEIELAAEEEAFVEPAWVGAEVSDDPRYLNVNLARHPYCNWPSGG